MKPLKTKIWNGKLSFIPCSITVCNMLCGLFAIMYLISGTTSITPVPKLAIWLIFAAMIFDTFDGFIARKLKAESLHGMELDSLSDIISFGIAPAILIYLVGQSWWDTSSPLNWINWVAAGFYAACTMWRLAQYNAVALSETPSKGRFTGLPSPAGALAIGSVMLLLNRIDPGPRTFAFVAVAYAAIMGFLMISGFEYTHVKKIVGSGPLPVRITLLILTILACIQFGSFALFALVHLYIFSGPLNDVLLKNSARAIDRIR